MRILYKVDYYTLARCGDRTWGNLVQYYDTWYTENDIQDIPKALCHIVDDRKGIGKYMPVITKIKKIKGHLR